MFFFFEHLPIKKQYLGTRRAYSRNFIFKPSQHIVLFQPFPLYILFCASFSTEKGKEGWLSMSGLKKKKLFAISVLVTTWYRVQFFVNNLHEKSILESQAEEILTAHAICNFHSCYNFALVWNEKCIRFQPIKSAQCLHIHRFYCCRRFRLSQFLIICIVSFMRDYFAIWV